MSDEKLIALGLDPSAPVLECEDLCVSYIVRAGAIPAVADFNLTVGRNEAVGLVGESGCGKSTVALAIMQYLGANGRIVCGACRFFGRDLTTMSPTELRMLRGSLISMVYQEPMASLNPSMRIGRQLMEVPIYHDGAGREEAYNRALSMLRDVRLPDPKRVMDAYPHQISGGQQQRVGIAMALLSGPKLLLLDEPTTALDVTVEAGIIELISEIASKFGTSLIYISHNLGLILNTCDKIAVMYSGEAVEVGAVGDVFDHMRHPYTRGLFASIPLPSADKTTRPLIPIRGQPPQPQKRPTGCNFGPRCDHFSVECDAGPVPMEHVDGPEGHHVRCVRWGEIDWGAATSQPADTAPHEVGDVVLRVDHMTKRYELTDGSVAALLGGGAARSIKANEDISFDAREAETVAIVGESGCGKSTLAKVLLGLETATEGSVWLGELDIANTPVRARRPQQIGDLQIVFQNPFETLNPSHSVGAQIARVIRKFEAERNPDQVKARVMKLLDTVKLSPDFYHRKPRQLSGGQKQRVGIARAFAGEPKVVVADEPVSALDVSVQAAVAGLLMDIQRENRTTLLFISHDLSVVRYLADKVVVMYLGQIMEQGAVADVFAPPYHPYTEALLSAVPIADTSVAKRRIVLEGEPPSAIDPPPGCPFQTRCHRRIEGVCDTAPPPLKDLGGGHTLLCHLDRETLDAMAPVVALAESTTIE